MPDTKPRNPFLHSHDHGHDHAHGEGHDHHHHDDHFEPDDPAQQSLADALRVSFTVLKAAMVALLVIYLFTGVFRVEEQYRAVRLRFGKIVGDPGQQVYGPGWHFGLPYPIEQKIIVPVAPRTVSITDQFWYQTTGSGLTPQELAASAGPLNPAEDGSLLTGDANIVHGRFQATYIISDPARYVRNVGSLEKADAIVRNVVEQGIVFAVAQTEADAVIRNQIDRHVAVSRMQDVLDELETGITLREQTFALTDRTMPLPVRSAYQAVINAESERARLVEVARQERTGILNAAAGEAHDALFDLVQSYERARAAQEAQRAEALSDQIDRAFDTLAVRTDAGPVPIGGEAAAIINRAHTYSTQIVQRVKAESNTFQSLLEQHRLNPELVRSQLWQGARQQIFTGDVETIYAPTQDRLNVLVNRDPRIAREREKQRLEAEQEAAREESRNP